MKVRELIDQLQQLPLEASVGMIYDGARRQQCDFVWLARSGEVLLAPSGGVFYTEDRPKNAPTAEKDLGWEPLNESPTGWEEG